MTDSRHISRLNRIFYDSLDKKQIKSHKQFIEAICAQSDATICMDKLIAKDGLRLVRESIQSDANPNFLNGPATDLLRFLQTPEIKTINSGQYLEKALHAIMDPPIFWKSFLAAFKAKQLKEQAQRSFAWLLHQLLTLPGDSPSPHLADAEAVLQALIESPILDIRNAGQKIKHTISVISTPSTAVLDDVVHPGGRHDNDFADFRKVAILPTPDELASKEPPFLRPSSSLDDPSTEHHRESLYLDNQFRLLREDMIYEMREELQTALGKPKGKKHRGFVVQDLKVVGVELGPSNRRNKWGMIFECKEDLPQLKNISDPVKRKKYLEENTKILKHQSLTCLIVNGNVMAFPSVRRDEQLLALKPRPRIVLEMEGDVNNLMLRLKSAQHVKIIQIDTAVFSYEPILNALKLIKELPLSEELLFWKDGKAPSSPSPSPGLSYAICNFAANPKQDIQNLLDTGKSIVLDNTQAESLLSGLNQKLSIIQGPPGTGKSFIGALLAKFLHKFSDQRILVVCYTNHALDQFLEDLLDIGIPIDDMVRIGGKSTTRTEPMMLQKQKKPFVRSPYGLVNDLKQTIEIRANSLDDAFDRYKQASVGNEDLLIHLEYDEPEFFEAFQVPTADDGMKLVGKKGRAIGDDYLLHQWRNGWNAGVFQNEPNVKAAHDIWNMSGESRQELLLKWTEDILKVEIEDFCDTAKEYNKLVHALTRVFRERDAEILRSKRIIGCTTTAAAKYGEDIQAAVPDVVLVEEAGEILESHIVTALGASAKQLIMIGDHKQLRPKVNNYKLTVEKDDGYDLNVSLFERLVLKGYPHRTLNAQHRMRPEISALIRHLTYPDLSDAPRTKNRPNLRGVRGNIVFINHSQPEDDMPQVADGRDFGSKSSKQNTYEVRMILKIVRYLAQQGYGTDKIVVLTPYLGQLSKLRNELKHDSETDPVLNDLDSYDLVRAGLLDPGAAKSGQRRLRLATIDNYQGEESEIVVVSLTRSNSSNDIGFMSSPERLNVLLSRARNALIMIGNSDTFTKSKKGKELYKKFFEFMKKQGHIHDGFPVRCEQHPNRVALLTTENQFDAECPDGGCSEPCGTKLSCGIHTCPSKCHQLADHSKMPCEAIIQSQCLNGHNRTRRCKDTDTGICKKCEKQRKDDEDRRQREFERQKKRDEDEAEHLRRMKQVENDRAETEQVLRDLQLKQERENALRRKKEDLKDLKDFVKEASKPQPPPSPPPAPPKSAANNTANSTKTSSNSPQPSTLPKSAADRTARWTKASSHPLQSPLSGVTSPQTATFPSSPASNSPEASSSRHKTTSKKPTASTNSIGRSGVPTSNPTTRDPSPTEQTWERKKSIEGATNNAIDAIMEMIGLENVKTKVMEIYDQIELSKLQNVSAKDQRFNVVLLGNPGTGKTTVARHYAKFLASVGLLPGMAFEETTGSRLANDGIPGVKKLLENVTNAGGGCIFLDEAYQLTADHNFQGKNVLDFLLAEMENNIGRIVFILAGYNKEMEKFFEHNTGLTSRVPHRLQFDDYKDPELLNMLEKSMHRKWSGKMKVEEGIQGLYGRIAIKRLGRGRGTHNFGNARALENLLARISERQAARIRKEKDAGYRPDPFLLINEDLIGPEPTQAIRDSPHWKKLQEMIGLTSVKESVQSLLDMVTRNYKRELVEQEPMAVSLNRVFIGSPGTGKTTVAGLYGQILAELGLLSNGEVVIKSPSDFVGSALGESQKNTKAILANTVGKVLVIDEAYMLYGGGKTGQQADPYKTDVIDTIVAEVQSRPGEDRCVLLLGYKDQMVEMFQNVNPGLSRRFAIEDAFSFEDFSPDELRRILDLKLKQQNLDATTEAKKVALDVLDRAKRRPNFGNGGEVENMLAKAKINYTKRIRGVDAPIDTVFEPVDFDPDFDRANHASDNLDELFKDVVGCEDVVSKLRKYQNVARNASRRNKDVAEVVPTSFVFKGPPGTGKTTTARKMGQVYYDMGLLGKPDVLECSASDLVGQYVGQTGPKVAQMFDKALGQVLFIDEAYRLREGHFAQEAIDEIVGLMTQDKYKGKIVVILAGYDDDINQLLEVNRGLASRFPEEVCFHNLSPEECIGILAQRLVKDGVRLEGVHQPASGISQPFRPLFEQLCSFTSWGNARDVLTIAKEMVGVAMDKMNDTDDDVTLESADAITCVENALARFRSRESNQTLRRPRSNLPMEMPSPRTQSPPSFNTTTKIVTEERHQPEAASEGDGRDPGVSDAIWHQLQLDKAAEEAAKKKQQEELQKAEEERREAARKEQEEIEKAKQLEMEIARQQDAARIQELKRQREQQRLREEQARRERERREAELKAQREAEERERKEEMKAQQKLREMGICPAGYRWIKQSGGYRCEAGGHFVSDAQLGR
ncbi:P-loop containing nucleoside triphosphate hydrolase protein [Dendrothele bispora CBS 962.96]|uniref:P-loop containing nucleoside triphosphate hydrolase protein n=1 Tax=Dendrothele bispora (strain CBS 962.96) TaxID=1314807 RepID=A0A4S8M513_DENBC|nr:P-loop containing nucleoside triphosphate hydrolase protein [Dendrothele bispora CBS 962.96]